MNVQQAKVENAADGRRLVKVTFTLPSEDPAKQPECQSTFWVTRPEAVHLDGEPFGLLLLSTIRTDTNEPLVLSVDQTKQVMEAAMIRAAEDAGLSWG